MGVYEIQDGSVDPADWDYPEVDDKVNEEIDD